MISAPPLLMDKPIDCEYMGDGAPSFKAGAQEALAQVRQAEAQAGVYLGQEARR
jgi:hypothetical protein